jgi:hypothetical protein
MADRPEKTVASRPSGDAPEEAKKRPVLPPMPAEKRVRPRKATKKVSAQLPSLAFSSPAPESRPNDGAYNAKDKGGTRPKLEADESPIRTPVNGSSSTVGASSSTDSKPDSTKQEASRRRVVAETIPTGGSGAVKRDPAPLRPVGTSTRSATIGGAEPDTNPAGVAVTAAEVTTRPAVAPVGPARRPRRARLFLTRIDPWSVMKAAFLLSVALGIVTIVAVLMVWGVLGAAGLWDSINSAMAGLLGSEGENAFDIRDYLGASRVVGFTTLVAVVDVVLLTAIATLAAFLYNMAAALLGGVEVTLSEEDH